MKHVGRLLRSLDLRSMRHGFWLACTVLCVALISSCERAPATTHELTFWTIGREGEAVVKLLPDFEHAHPDIRVNVQQLPLSAAHQKLLTAFAGGSTPDMAQLGNTWLPEMVALDALEPLQARIDRLHGDQA